MSRRLTAVVLMVTALWSSRLDARKFTDATGRYSVEAEVYDVRDGTVRLKKASGDIVELPLSTLCLADQKYVLQFADQTPRLPSLEETLSGLLREIKLGGGKPLFVVHVSDDRVYVNLGAEDGAMAGTQLEIIRSSPEAVFAGGSEPAMPSDVAGKDVAGKIVILSVQQRLSTCKLLEGKAEQKNSLGQLNHVLPAEDSQSLVRLGRISLPADTGLSKAQITEGLTSAFRNSDSFQLAPYSEAIRLELRVAGKAAQNGVDLDLSLIDRKTGRQIATATGRHPTGVSLALLGYKCGVEADLGVELKMDPVRKALEDRFNSVRQAGRALFIEAAGPRREVAWVFPDSRIVIAAKRNLSDPKQSAQLAVAWIDVARTIAGVVAELKEDQLSERLTYHSQVFTEKTNQLQSLYVAVKRRSAWVTGDISAWVINWPDARPSWAILMAAGSRSKYYPNCVYIDEKEIIKNNTDQPQEASLTHLQYGEHSLSAKGQKDLFFEIRVYFAEPNGRISMYDKSNQPTATCSMYSMDLSSIVVPMVE